MADVLEKFSDFTEADPSTLEAAGSIVPSAVPGVGNNKSSWTSIKNWIKSWMLGETSELAYRGDRGKVAYDHSQATGNPHAATAADVGAAASLHGDQHGYGESDPISVDTRQISNMSAFGRSLVDDASAADARTTLDAAPSTATLADSAASTTLPTAGAATALATLLQQVRNNLKGIIGDFVSKTETSLQTIASHLNGPSVFAVGVNTAEGNDSGRLDLFGAGANTTARGAGIQIQGKDRGGANAGGGIYHDTANITSASAAHIFRIKGVTKAAISNDGATRVFALDALAGSDTTPLAANAQTQLNNRYTKSESDIRYTQNASAETITESWLFTAIPSVPNQPPESVGSGAANAQFVADKTYPGYQGTDITATGSITPAHSELRKVNANGLTITLTNTPVLGTVSWLYYSPVSCSTGTLTLSFTDVLGTTRTYQKTASSGASHLPHLIKLVRALGGWIVEWETES